MRLGWIGSPLAHGLLLAALLFSWPMARRELPKDSSIVPIDVVSFTDQSNVSAIATPDAAPAPTDKVDPEGSPQPAQPKEEAEPTPDLRVKPPPKEQARQSPNLDEFQKLIDRSKKTVGTAGAATRTTNQFGSKARAGVGLRNNLSANEMDYLASKFEKCWRSTSDKRDPERLRVVVHIELRKSGALKGEPVLAYPTFIAPGDTELQAAARNALNAVRICAPFSEFKPERYAYWKSFDLDMHSNGEIQ